MSLSSSVLIRRVENRFCGVVVVGILSGIVGGVLFSSGVVVDSVVHSLSMSDVRVS